MHRLRFHVSLTAAALLAASLSQPASGAGFSIFEQGAKATGMGGAFTATADDPSAMFYNVAGLAQQRKMSGMSGATIIYFDSQFESSPDSFLGEGQTAYFEEHVFTPPNTYLTIPIGENATFGLGQFTAFGLRTDWADGDQYIGRFISQDANLKTTSIQPSFAMQHFDGRFAWGLGVEYRAAHVTLERNSGAINPFTQRIVDIAHIRLDSDWESELGYNAGVLFKLSDTWSVGASYRTDMEIEFEGDATFTQIPTGNAQLDAIVRASLPPDQGVETAIKFPAFTHFGVATTAIPNWQIGFDVVNMTWSEFKDIRVQFNQTPQANFVNAQNWEDVWSYRIGGNRKVTDNWDIRLGAVFDENPQPVESVGPLLPDSDRAGISFGIGFHGEHWRLDLTEFALVFLDRNTLGRNPDGLDGEYQTTANLISLNAGYTF